MKYPFNKNTTPQRKAEFTRESIGHYFVLRVLTITGSG